MNSHRAARRFSVGLIVAALHLVCALAWWTMEHRYRPIPKNVPSVPLTVWLMPIAEPLGLALVPRKPLPTLSGQHNRTGKGKLQVVDEQVDSTDTDTAPRTSVTPVDSASQQGTLNLTLSKRDLKAKPAPNAAAMSPFHAPLPKTVETQIANAFSHSGPWVEERIDDDHIRMRRGDTCITVTRSLAEGLDAFSDHARRIPWRTGTPYKCQ
jgi:hypothetical protein